MSENLLSLYLLVNFSTFFVFLVISLPSLNSVCIVPKVLIIINIITLTLSFNSCKSGVARLTLASCKPVSFAYVFFFSCWIF